VAPRANVTLFASLLGIPEGNTSPSNLGLSTMKYTVHAKRQWLLPRRLALVLELIPDPALPVPWLPHALLLLPLISGMYWLARRRTNTAPKRL